MDGNVFWGTHAALAAGANPAILMIGDSWFWYPFNNLAQEVGAVRPKDQVLVIGNNGAEAAEWEGKYRKDIDHGFGFYGSGAQVLMLSGGGNDVAGMKDFLRIIEDDCSGAATVRACYRIAEPRHLMTRLMGHYRALIQKFRSYNKTAPVVLHHYDYAWPSGVGVFGPADWLQAPMTRAKVPAALQRKLFADLIRQLRAAQQALAKEGGLGTILVAPTAGCMPNQANMWANELHPTSAGFALITRKAMAPVLKQVLG